MSEKNYYCQKCGHNHRYTSKIGKKHLQYKTISHNVPRKPAKVQENVQSIHEPEQTTPIINKEKSNWISLFVQDYRASYRKGVEKFGVWWTIFQLSLWSLALIFLLTASIIFIVYLPKIEMILLDLV